MGDVYDLAYEGEIKAVRPLGIVRRQGSLALVDGEKLSDCRNALDAVTFGGQDCADFADGYGIPRDPDDERMCLECDQCKAIILRDRIDYWLDRAGFERSVWLNAIGPEVEDLWIK